jgi:predicted membrane protein
MKPKLMVKKQSGMTMLSWLIVLAIVVFFILIGIKMVPTYLENYSIKQVLKNMENDRDVRAMSAGEMKKSFLKRLKINSVYEFDRDAIKIKKEKSGTSFKVDYEIRKPVAGNVSIIMVFSESANFPPP